DLAAAGAAPLAFSMGLICPPDMGEDWLRPLFRGMAALADEHRLVLSGGDISAGDKLGFCLTIWGRRAGPERFLRRGALPGQTIFAVGPSCAPPKTPGCSLGLARLGLLLLEERGREAEAEYPAACSALLRPRPQIEAAAVLAGLAHTPEDIFLMDVSDGLMRDLPRLLGGGRAKPDAPDAPGAELNLDAALLHPELRAFAHRAAKGVEDETQKIMLEFALTGGDDYLLLGAAKAELIPQIRAGLPKHSSLTPLGQVEPTPGLRRQGRPLEEVLRTRAFDHFS
ncbi:MAG: thiamine-phosphate kinase, partial [Deltaproteobacteria bacterium]|nr:thiamine-phosphate kinase [Deltaproteobacteria bacterium]